MKAPKVSFLLTALDSWGGIETVMTVWANYMLKVGLNVEIVASESPQKYSLGAPFAHDILSLREDLAARQHWLIALQRIRHAYIWFKKSKPELIVMTKSVQLLPFSVLKLIGLLGSTKLVYHAHMSAEQYRLKYSSWKKTLLRASLDALVVLIDDRENRVHAQSFPKFVHEMPNPKPFESPNVSPLNSKLAIYVGRLSEEKGVSFLLKAWAVALTDPRSEGWTLRIVGDGPEATALKFQARELKIEKTIDWQGFKTNVISDYLESSFIVMPSRYEGLPMVLLEAKEMGLPMVTTNHLGAQRFIEPETEGLIGEYGDINGFAGQLVRMMTSPELRRKMGQKTRARASEFSVASLFEAWVQLFAKIDFDPRLTSKGTR